MKFFANSKKKLGVFFALLAFFCFLGVISLFVLVSLYQGKIAPNVFIGPFAVGGASLETLKNQLYKKIDPLLLEGVLVSVQDKTVTLPLVSLGTENLDTTIEYVHFDLDQTLENALTFQKKKSVFLKGFFLLKSFFQEKHIPFVVSLDENRLKIALRELFPNQELMPVNSIFLFSPSQEGWNVSVSDSWVGRLFQTEDFFSSLQKQLENLSLEPLSLSLQKTEPEITQKDLNPFIHQVQKILEKAPYVLTYDPHRFFHREWIVSAKQIQEAIQTEKQEKISLSLSMEKMEPFLSLIAQEIETPPLDATFALEEGKVVQFTPSQQGTNLNKQATLDVLLSLWQTEIKEAAIVTEQTEPTITTADVNDLGIGELLGIGVSNFSGSPINRIKNIQNGSRLLQGILIKPQEEFSLLQALGPFTKENGYVPELVIRGDEIIPEYGGGLCQIGTTTFRTAMNSGLPITQRNNHSLVVSYYNDPSNGNPGTDATIYDPAPDFRFLNDTEHSILFQTETNPDTGELKFSFWGTSDRRIGSYSAPIVERWIPVGETRFIETEKIEPGKEHCQSAHLGADASFVYTIERQNGTQEQTIFESHYRPLPKICLKGIEPKEITTEEESP